MAIRDGRVARTAPLVAMAGRTAGESVIARLRGRDRADVHARAAQRYAEQLGRSRGVLMKAGQILSFVSLGPTLGGPNSSVYQQAFEKLQDDAPPLDPEAAAQVVREELGADPGEVFAEFSPTPLAAASIGQVHAARTHDGQDVVVKVQYPGVAAAIRADLANTELLATFFQLVRGMGPDLGRTDARALAGEVAARIGEEIDYVTEAVHQTRFAEGYDGHPFIRVPRVLPELSTARVLTQERSHGRRWAAVQDAPQELKDRWGEGIYRFTVGSLRALGCFNADPHPGNYLFHDDGTVTFLDFGCVKHFRAEQIRWMRGAVQCTVEGDGEGLLRHYVHEGFVDPDDPPSPAGLLAWSRGSFQALLAQQPYRYTPEYAASLVDSEFSPLGPNAEVVKKLSLPQEYVTLSRIDLGMTAVLGQLRASSDWRGIRDEWDCEGPPATELGVLEAEWRRRTMKERFV
jgi:predicted unusual protein kinase regulating ubiquinone biosynthesis (AarF/ABC1/UbiB family)